MRRGRLNIWLKWRKWNPQKNSVPLPVAQQRINDVLDWKNIKNIKMRCYFLRFKNKALFFAGLLVILTFSGLIFWFGANFLAGRDSFLNDAPDKVKMGGMFFD